MKALLTQKEYARRKGVTAQYINRLVREGTIVLVHGKVDPRQADAAKSWPKSGHGSARRKAAAKKGGRASARSRAARKIDAAPKPESSQQEASPRRGSASTSLTYFRAKETEAKAGLAQLELAKAMREALPRAEVRQALELLFGNFRSGLRRLARALPPRLHGHSLAESESILLEDFDLLLAGFSADPLGLKARLDVAAPDEPMTPESMEVPPVPAAMLEPPPNEGSVASL